MRLRIASCSRPTTCLSPSVFRIAPSPILGPWDSRGTAIPAAAYAIFDTQARTWEARRVEYDVPMVQKRIRDAGLPPRHGLRLAEGW